MPLITINYQPPKEPGVVPRLLEAVQKSGAEALKCAPGNVWVLFQPIVSGYYLQNPKVSSTPDSPIVIIKAQTGRTAEDKYRLVASVAGAVGRGLSVPATSVWIHYQEMSPKDVWFEGQWAG